MVGVICRRNILAHPFVTIRCFGWRVFFRALIAGRSQTFLSVLADAKGLQPPKVRVPELIERCAKLELQAGRIYEGLAERFLDHKLIIAYICEEIPKLEPELAKECRELRDSFSICTDY